jgi:hypothetical protein
MGSAHPLVEVNIWAKIEEYISVSVGLTERTRHTVLYLIVWYLTFKCDLDLELTHWQHRFCTSPCWDEHFSQVWRKSFNWYRIYRADTIMETDGRTYGRKDATKRIHFSPPPILWWGYKYEDWYVGRYFVSYCLLQNTYIRFKEMIKWYIYLLLSHIFTLKLPFCPMKMPKFESFFLHCMSLKAFI